MKFNYYFIFIMPSSLIHCYCTIDSVCVCVCVCVCEQGVEVGEDRGG